MPTIPLRVTNSDEDSLRNSLPTLLQTPSGIAILEIQGTIHAPFPGVEEDADTSPEAVETPIGRLEFPLYNPRSQKDDSNWMKRVYLYVGKNQRLTGEIKKLPKPLIVVSKRQQNIDKDEDTMEVDQDDQIQDELDIVEVIRYKILFGGRPEPVGD